MVPGLLGCVAPALVAEALADAEARDELADALADALAEPAASVGDAAADDAAAEPVLVCEAAGADVRATEAGAVGDDAHADGAGRASALLTPARTPMTPRAATLLIRPMRSVRDWAAYQSRTLSARARKGLGRGGEGTIGALGASAVSSSFQLMKEGLASWSIARRARSLT